MAVNQEQIGITIIVVIKEPQAPTAQHLCRRANLARLVRENKILLVVIKTEKFTIDIRYEKILPTIAIVIRRIHSHSRTRFARVAVGHAGRQANFFEFSTTLIDK